MSLFEQNAAAHGAGASNKAFGTRHTREAGPMPWAKRPIFEWIAIFSGPKHQLLRTI